MILDFVSFSKNKYSKTEVVKNKSCNIILPSLSYSYFSSLITDSLKSEVII